MQRPFVKMFKHKINYVYYRDGYLQFLRAIMSHPRVKFTFYSTIIRPNILPIILKAFDSDMGLLSEHMSAIFDQKFNKPAPEITGEPYGFIRDL